MGAETSGKVRCREWKGPARALLKWRVMDEQLSAEWKSSRDGIGAHVGRAFH